MAIRVTCDGCGKVLIAKDENAGKKAKCPDCGNVLLVPAPDIVDAEQIEEEPFSYASSNDGESSSDDRRACPACGEEIKKSARKCRFCDEVLDPDLKRTSGSGRRKSSRYGGNSDRTADLGKRFLGALIDGVASIVFVGPGYGLIIAGGSGEGPDKESPLLIAGVAVLVLGILALLAMQLYLVATRSQSIGKYLVKTQIHDCETNAPASFVKCFLLRGVVNGLIGAIPCIGGIYSLADILFIFGEEHRCLHDRIAGTCVVDIS